MKLAQRTETFPGFEGKGRKKGAVEPSVAGNERMVDELKRENARLRRTVAELESYRALAYRDVLTGLWNRRYFEERLGQEMSLARRKPSKRFSLLALDLNDLKQINDQEGHAAGDAALQRAATFLKSRLREHDVCCRVGGDEFVVLLRDLGPAECVQLCTRLRQELVKANATLEAPISLSMGFASYPDTSLSPQDLCLRADEAMYEDKRRHKSGQNVVAFTANATPG
jgi:diguanylate cyclase (GGDEF)-like protein